jgi:hypothetical protein
VILIVTLKATKCTVHRSITLSPHPDMFRRTEHHLQGVPKKFLLLASSMRCFRFLHFFFWGCTRHFVLRIPYLFYLLVHSRCRGSLFFTWPHSDTHHRWKDSSGRGIGPSQRPLHDNTQTLTRDKHPYPRGDSIPRSYHANGHRPTP